ncbi:MAG: hypothetical protein QOD93_606, partial [Acetobacteraceae bacterium]|nr:hypothetical protein [Acetobacteraceae bacterium]
MDDKLTVPRQVLRGADRRWLWFYRNADDDLLEVANYDPVTLLHTLLYDNETSIAG